MISDAVPETRTTRHWNGLDMNRAITCLHCAPVQIARLKTAQALRPRCLPMIATAPAHRRMQSTLKQDHSTTPAQTL